MVGVTTVSMAGTKDVEMGYLKVSSLGMLTLKAFASFSKEFRVGEDGLLPSSR